MVFLRLSDRPRRRRRLVPASIEELLANEHMVEHLLKEIYGYDPDSIESMSVRKETSGGMQGNLSDSGRVVIKLQFVDKSTGNFSWFVKIKPRGSSNSSSNINNNNINFKNNNSEQDQQHEFDIFRNEIEFYQKILPDMTNFLVNEGFAQETADLFDVPDMLYAGEEEDGAIIILQDILSDGYKHIKDINDEKYLSLELAMAAVKSIAKIHAVSVAIQEKNKVDLATEYPILAESGLVWTQAEMATRLAVMKDSYCQLLQQSAESDSPTLLKRFRNTFDSEERLIELCERRIKASTSKTLSLQHGDFHFNNLMFKREEDGSLKIKIVDWQLTYCGKTSGDLSYLLMSSLSHETRESYEDEIKSEYFATYLSYLKKLSNTGLSAVVLDMDYTDSLPLSFFLSCGNIMAHDQQEPANQGRSVKFSYEMCKEAVMKEII